MVRPSLPTCFLATVSSTLPLISTASASGSTTSQCTRSFLKSITSQYITAQSLGESAAFITSLLSPSGNLTTSPSLTTSGTSSSGRTGPYTNTTTPFLYKENESPLSPTSPNSTLSIPLKIDFHRSAHDPTRCATFTELIAAGASNPGHPYVIHTRMEFNPVSLLLSLIESVVTDEGDWLFNATNTLTLALQEGSWPPARIPLNSSLRNTYSQLQAVGDSYFNRFSNTSILVPWGPPCLRIEGGLPARGNLTSTGDCIQEWPSTIIVPWRRYVVDVEMGVVDIFVGFPGLDRSQGQNAAMPDSHVFRVEGGRIRFLHTASACVVGGCGLNGTFFGSGMRTGMGTRMGVVEGGFGRRDGQGGKGARGVALMGLGRRSVRRDRTWRFVRW